MQDIINFLQEVDKHNNREWFTTNKDWYKRVQAKWNNRKEIIRTSPI